MLSIYGLICRRWNAGVFYKQAGGYGSIQPQTIALGLSSTPKRAAKCIQSSETRTTFLLWTVMAITCWSVPERVATSSRCDFETFLVPEVRFFDKTESVFQIKGDGLEKIMELQGHKGPVVAVDWSVAMNCSTCATGSVDGRVKLSTLLSP
jgi:WD40 repeat protein